MPDLPPSDKDPAPAPSIGDTLRKHRLNAGQSPYEAATAAGLPPLVVIKLESGALSLDDVPTRAYLRMYARHLDLDAEALLHGLEPGGDVGPTGPDAFPEGGGPPAPGSLRRWFFHRKSPGGLAVVVGLPLGAVVVGMVIAAAVLGGGEQRLDFAPPEQAPADRDAPATPTPTPSPLDATPSVERPDTTVSPAPGDPDSREDPQGQQDPQGSTGPGAQEEGDPARPGDGADTALRDPADTAVQVLHNNASDEVVADVTELLESFGYQVRFVRVAQVPFDATTVFHVEGWHAEAEALQDRDPRFAAVSANELFSTEVHLHVAIGADWVTP